MPEPKKEKQDPVVAISASLERLQAFMGPRPLIDKIVPDDSKERSASLSQVARDLRSLSLQVDENKQPQKPRSR